MNKIISKSILGIVAGLLTLPASAALVSLTTATPTVETGQQFTINVFMDVTDAAGDQPGDIWGKPKITFDSSLVRYDGFSLANNVSYKLSELTVNDDDITIDFETASKSFGRIGVLTFTALADAGSVLNFGIEDSNLFITSFFNTSPSNQPINNIIYRGAEVSVVPIPAAVWLFGSGLVGLFGWSRRRAMKA